MPTPRGWDLTAAEIELLRLCAQGRTLRPSDLTEPFTAIADRLLYLRRLGLVRLEDGRIMKNQAGRFLMAGPCDLTDDGSRVLEQDEWLGPRLP